MKTSTIIWYIVIAVVVYYLIYKAYTNYQASGSIFSSEPLVVLDNTGESTSRFGVVSRAGYISARDCLRMCPSCTWTTNGRCFPPTRNVIVRS